MIRLLKYRGGTIGRITSDNPVLADDVIGIDPDAGVLKIGDGSTPWNQLASIGGSSGDIDGGTP